jgi:hypothetical protein
VRLLITQGLAGTNLDPYRYRNLLHATPAAPGNRPNQPAARQRTAAQAGGRRTG